MYQRILLFPLVLLILGQLNPLSAQDQPSGADTTIVIRQVQMAADIENNAPLEVKNTFSMADKFAFCFVRYENYGMSTTLRFRWIYNDKLHFTFDAKTHTGRGLSTYSVVSLLPGNWKVELFSPAGMVLKTVRFKVTT